MSNSELSSITSYFRSCYQADNREVNLNYFLASKVELPYFLENSDLLEGHIPIYPVEEGWFAKVSKQLSMYSKEKELYVASHFLLGYSSEASRGQRIFAPLFLHPASLVEERGEFYVKMNSEKRVFNPSFVRLLRSEDNEVGEAYEDIIAKTPEGFIDFGKNIEIKDALLQHFPNLDVEDLLLYPDVPEEERVKKMLSEVVRKKMDGFRVVPVQVLGILRKSPYTQGVLNELKQISDNGVFSEPLKSIFLRKASGGQAKERGQIYVPVTLNEAQVKAFNAVRSHVVSYILGPPGTGKSFTIAALAIDYLSRGKSVLIASSNNQAVDVIADKIEQDFGLPDVLVRGGRQDYKKQLKQRLQALLSGMVRLDSNPQLIQSLESKCDMLYQRICLLEKRFHELEEREIKYGQVLQGSGFWIGLKQWWGKFRIKEKNSLWVLLEQYQKDLDAYNVAIRRLVSERFTEQLKRSLHSDREQLQRFERAIKARTATRKEEVFGEIDFGKLTSTFPIWLVASSEVNNILPLKEEMFDLVIIDEATQCDIATAIPVLQRGEKVIVSGDPKQLRHVSFLSKKRQQMLQEQTGLGGIDTGLLDYRNSSFLDIVNDSIVHQSQISFLNEHYRSFPHIISFSNKMFYNDALHVILSTPQTQKEQRVFVHRLEGKRHSKGYNVEEAQFLMGLVKTLVKEDGHLPANRCRSIGILSPFREQINHLVSLINSNLSSEEIQRHRVLIGTTYSFQGEERDVMFLSFVLDNQTHPSAFRHLNRPDVFNVSVTRAKAEQHILISMSSEKLQPKMLLAQYIDWVETYHLVEQRKVSEGENKDKFMSEMVLWFKDHGFDQIYTAYPVAGIEVDILVIQNEKAFCVDLIGFPGQFEAAFPIERYKMLNRVGIKIFPLSYSMWLHNREVTQKAFLKFFN